MISIDDVKPEDVLRSERGIAYEIVAVIPSLNQITALNLKTNRYVGRISQSVFGLWEKLSTTSANIYKIS